MEGEDSLDLWAWRNELIMGAMQCNAITVYAWCLVVALSSWTELMLLFCNGDLVKGVITWT